MNGSVIRVMIGISLFSRNDIHKIFDGWYYNQSYGILRFVMIIENGHTKTTSSTMAKSVEMFNARW